MWLPLERRCLLTAVFGSEVEISTASSESQQTYGSRAVASDGAGHFVATWESYNQDSPLSWGVRAARFNADGSAIGSEILVNAGFVLFDQRRPQVAMNSSGAFVIAWEGRGLLGTLSGIYVQRFAADGSPVGSIIGVAGGVLAPATHAAIGMDDDGDFVVAYQSTDAALSMGILAQRYAADGTPVDAEFVVNATTSGTQDEPVVAMHAGGAFAIGWEGNGSGDGSGVFATFYSASGSAINSELPLNSTTAGTQDRIALAARAGGGYLAAWSGNGAGDGAGVFARGFSGSGVPDAAAFLVNQTTIGAQSEPSVSCDADGDYVVVWSGQGAADTVGVYAREFDASGAVRTGEFGLNATIAGSQQAPSITTLGDNGYAAVWFGAGASDAEGVFGRVLANQTPAITMSGGSASYTENGPGIAVDGGAAVIDADSPRLVGATVAITAGYRSAEDLLSIPGQPGISVSWDSVTGTLTLSGAATLAQYQTALRAVVYVNTSDDPSAAARTIRMTVNDGVATHFATRALIVTPVNDAPVAGTSGGTAALLEDGGAVMVDPGIVLADVDSASLAGATVRIATGYVSGQDVLQFTMMLGIAGWWDGASGALTLSGAATVADYQAALRTVLFLNSSQSPSGASRTVEFTVTDGSDTSNTPSRVVTVTGVNDAPVVTTSGGSAAVTENGSPVPLDPGLGISDVDSPTLSGATVRLSAGYVSGQDFLNMPAQPLITASWDSSTGTLTLSGVATVADYQAATRAVVYTNSSENPTSSPRIVEFRVTDGVDFSNAPICEVTVTPVNDAPVGTASSGAASYIENGAGAAVDPGFSLIDVDSSTLAGATIQISSGYVLGEDGLSLPAQPSISASWDSATGTLTLLGVAAIAEYQAALRAVVYESASDNPGAGARTIEFIVNDGSDASSPVSRVVNVVAVNDAPVATASGGAASYTENGVPAPVDPGFTIADVDSTMLVGATVRIASGYVAGQDSLAMPSRPSITTSWDASTGTLTLSGAATIAEYQAALRAVTYINSSDDPDGSARSVEFAVDDGASLSNTPARALTVAPVNDAPDVAASSGAVSYLENALGVAVDLALTLTDVDSPTLVGATVRIAAGYSLGQDVLAFPGQPSISASWDAASGMLTLSGVATLAAYQAALRAVTFVNSSENPDAAPRSIEFVVDDGVESSAASSRAVVVTGVNDPSVVTSSGGSASYVENDPGGIVDAWFWLADVDSLVLAGATIRIASGYVLGEDSLGIPPQPSISSSWDASTGTLTLSGAATISEYQAAIRAVVYANSSDDPDASPRTIEMSVSDGLDLSNAAARSVTVTPVNDAPIAAASSGAAIFIENDTGTLVAPGFSIADVDSVFLAGATVRFGSGFAVGEDVLVFVPQGGISGVWDAVGGVLTLTGPADVGAYIAALRSVVYLNASDAPAEAARTLEFIVDDGADASPVTTRAIFVTPVNDAPIAAASFADGVFTENQLPLEVWADLTLADADSPDLAWALVCITSGYLAGHDQLVTQAFSGLMATWDGATGTLILSGAAGVATYEAALRTLVFTTLGDDPGNAIRVLTLTLGDGVDTSVPRTVTVELRPVNDAPRLSLAGSPITYDEDAPALPVDPFLGLADPDSLVLGATVAVLQFVPGDELAAVAAVGVTVEWNAATATLTLSGAAVSSVYEAILRTLVFRSASDNPTNQPRTIDVSVTDADGGATSAQRRVIVSPADDPPSLEIAGAVASVVAGAASQLAVQVRVTDADSAYAQWVEIRITDGFLAGDVLAIDPQAGFAATFDSARGILRIDGPLPLTDINDVVAGVLFTAIDMGDGQRAFEFAIGVDGAEAAYDIATGVLPPVPDAPDDPPPVDLPTDDPETPGTPTDPEDPQRPGRDEPPIESESDGDTPPTPRIEPPAPPSDQSALVQRPISVIVRPPSLPGPELPRTPPGLPADGSPVDGSFRQTEGSGSRADTSSTPAPVNLPASPPARATARPPAPQQRPSDDSSIPQPLDTSPHGSTAPPPGPAVRASTEAPPASQQPQSEPKTGASSVQLIISHDQAASAHEGSVVNKLVDRSFVLVVSSGLAGAAAAYALWTPAAAWLSRRAMDDLHRLWSVDVMQYVRGRQQVEWWRRLAHAPLSIRRRRAA